MGIYADHSGCITALRCAGCKAALQLGAIQVSADKDDAGFAFLICPPRPLMIAFDDHMNALHNETLRIVLECNNALEAQNIRPVHLRYFLNPGEKTIWIEITTRQGNGADTGIMVIGIKTLVAGMMVPMMMSMIMIAIGPAYMIIGVFGRPKKRRIVFQHSGQIKGATI